MRYTSGKRLRFRPLPTISFQKDKKDRTTHVSTTLSPLSNLYCPTTPLSTELSSQPQPISLSQVAEYYGVSIRTINNDLRKALGRSPSLNPVLIDQPLLDEIHLVRRWCYLRNYFAYFTYRNFLIERKAGTVEQTLSQYSNYFL